MITILLTPVTASAAGFNFNVNLGDMISDKLKPHTKYEMVIPRDAAELNHKEAIKLYEDVAAVAYKKKFNIIIEAPATSTGKKIYAVIENKERNIALKKGGDNSFKTKMAMSRISKMKLVAGKEYKIILRSHGVGAEI